MTKNSILKYYLIQVVKINLILNYIQYYFYLEKSLNRLFIVVDLIFIRIL
jgi:hypothetical protein